MTQFFVEIISLLFRQSNKKFGNIFVKTKNVEALKREEEIDIDGESGQITSLPDKQVFS